MMKKHKFTQAFIGEALFVAGSYEGWLRRNPGIKILTATQRIKILTATQSIYGSTAQVCLIIAYEAEGRAA